ncbi:MAG: glutamate 5-kinase [Gammaproteobacteria bacterium]
MSQGRTRLRQARRWVIKIGSALATNDGQGLNVASIDAWTADAAVLWRSGREVVLVTSGAVAEGVARLGWKKRPHALHELQAAAAVGQMGLVRAYETCFQRHGIKTAQVLLTHEDVSNRQRYLNARSTLRTLLELRVIPVINENDTVATEEIKLGDNDTLGALAANLIEADVLVLLTDQAGLFDKDPRHHPDARLVAEANAGDLALEAMAGDGGAWGRGGMRTKVRAAKLAARSGTATVIAAGQEPGVISRLAAGEALGTLFLPGQESLAARKRWLASGLKQQGSLRLDAGAVRVLREQGRSLLAVGVREVEGEFQRGALVVCLDPEGREVARGLVNYSAGEARAIKGLPSDQIEATLGYADEPELIHRDNLVLT